MSKKKPKKIHPTQNTNLVKVRTEPKAETFSLGVNSNEGVIIHHFKVHGVVKYCKVAVGGRILLHYNPSTVHPIGTVGNVVIESKEVPTTSGVEVRDVITGFTATGVNQVVNNAIVRLENVPELYVGHTNSILERIMLGETDIVGKVVGRAGENIFYTK